MSEDYTSIDYQMTILQAAKEGKAIEITRRRDGRPLGAWRERTDTDLLFNFARNCYRVKKEPRKFTVWCRGNGCIFATDPSQAPEMWLKGGWELVEVMEVVK